LPSKCRIPLIYAEPALYGLVAHGEFNLLEITGGGDIAIRGLFLRCATAQTVKGSAIDLEHGFITNIQLSDLQVAPTFFNGFNLVGTGTTEISNIFINDILLEEYTGGVKSYGNAAFKIGSSTQRVVRVIMVDVEGHANKQTDMPKWFKVANTDSLTLTNCGFQNGLEGFNVGEGDTSTQGTTNLILEGVWFDGGPEGMGKGYQLQRPVCCELHRLPRTGCNPGMYVQGDVSPR